MELALTEQVKASPAGTSSASKPTGLQDYGGVFLSQAALADNVIH